MRPIRSVTGGSARIGGAEIKMSVKKPPHKGGGEAIHLWAESWPKRPRVRRTGNSPTSCRPRSRRPQRQRLHRERQKWLDPRSRYEIQVYGRALEAASKNCSHISPPCYFSIAICKEKSSEVEKMPDTGFGQKKPPRRAAERSFIFERKTGPNGPNKKDYSQYRKVTCVAGDSFHEPHHQKANGREPNI